MLAGSTIENRRDGAHVEHDALADVVELGLRDDGRLGDLRLEVADVRVASKSELYERAPLSSYLAQIARNLLPEQRSTILRCLREVIQVDRKVTYHEIDFFNQVATALGATPAEIVGLTASH